VEGAAVALREDEGATNSLGRRGKQALAAK